jgi:hypothetical protein
VITTNKSEDLRNGKNNMIKEAKRKPCKSWYPFHVKQENYLLKSTQFLFGRNFAIKACQGKKWII